MPPHLRLPLLAILLTCAPLARGDIRMFTETRERPIRRTDTPTDAWKSQPQTSLQFNATAQPGEYYVFQIGLFDETLPPPPPPPSTSHSANSAPTPAPPPPTASTPPAPATTDAP